MSTSDAITHAAATIFSKDLCAHLYRRELTPGKTNGFVRFAVLVFGATAYLVAV